MENAVVSTDGEDNKELDHGENKPKECEEEHVASTYEEAVENLASLMEERLNIEPPMPKEYTLLESASLEGVAQYIKSGKAKNIMCMCGAGISVSAGIPDFRSPGTGLYQRIMKLGLSQPEEVFSLEHFKLDPKPFYEIAKEIVPGTYKPTATHYFMSLLGSKGMLLRCYTQNIDSLEMLAGLDPELVVAAHGSFEGAHCIDCHKEASITEVKAKLRRGEIIKCFECGGYVKPDIVLFGENLPNRFFEVAQHDLPKCDLLIVMGTSLVVYPFAALSERVCSTAPRLLINREPVGDFDFACERARDIFYQGDCDAGVRMLAELLGWEDELQSFIESQSTMS